MGFWEWMGFENPRDSPKTEQPKEGLPQVTDNVRDSGQTFVFGRSNAREQVDEKAAMQIPTVYACVRLLAESIAALPLHLYRMTDDNGNKEKARDHPLYKILYRQPNPEEDPDSEPGEGEEKKPFQKDTAGHLFSSRQMDLIVLNRLGVKPEDVSQKHTEPKEPPADPKPSAEPIPPAEPPANPGPVLDMDGKTEDGSIPYNILMKQLECMK